MTNWLSNVSRPQPIDFSPIMGTLAGIEGAIKAIREARKQVDDEYGTDYSPQRRYQLDRLADMAKTTLSDLQRSAREQFAALGEQAAAQRVDARRDFHTSPDGAQYRQALAGYAPLAQHMTADALAERLADATAAGLIGEARAWSDLARAQYPGATGTVSDSTASKFPNTALRTALDTADSVAKTQAEQAADSSLATVGTAAQRFGVFSLTTESRLNRVLQGANDVGAGNFDSANIFVADADGGE